VPFLLPVIPLHEATGRPNRPRLLGCDRSESPSRLDRGLVRRPPDAPLGFVHRLNPERSDERFTGLCVHLASCRALLPTTRCSLAKPSALPQSPGSACGAEHSRAGGTRPRSSALAKAYRIAICRCARLGEAFPSAATALHSRTRHDPTTLIAGASGPAQCLLSDIRIYVKYFPLTLPIFKRISAPFPSERLLMSSTYFMRHLPWAKQHIRSLPMASYLLQAFPGSSIDGSQTHPMAD
jgi:hypothetical protein